MTASPTAGTRLLLLLGDPVAHSHSPTFQNAAIRAAGLDGVYVALRCDAAALPGLLRGVALAGGAGNVTVPHKQAAVDCLDRALPAVAATGACNTFWLEDGRVHGDNTDVAGVRAAVRALCPAGPGGMVVVLAGAGGAAAAALHALLEDGVGRVTLLNRDRARADALRTRCAVPGRVSVVPAVGALDGERFDLAINATSLGLRPGEPLPLDPHRVHYAVALDLVYARGGTPWVHATAALGRPAADGREMLLHQGAAAFRRWWRREPPLQEMRAALEAALRP